MPANIGSELQQLPLGYMLASPMTAAIEAQALAAQSTVEFIQNVGLQEDETTGDLTVRTAQFGYTAPVPDPDNPGTFVEVDTSLTVPILSIVPVPFIRIEDLNVTFEFKIRDIQSRVSKFETTGSTGYSVDTETKAKFGGGILGFLGGPKVGVKTKTHFEANVSATYQSTSRQSTDRSATFKMTLKAVQDQIPEGLSRVLTILNDTIQAQKAPSSA